MVQQYNVTLKKEKLNYHVRGRREVREVAGDMVFWNKEITTILSPSIAVSYVQMRGVLCKWHNHTQSAI